MTITLPEDLAVRFLKRVPARDRSKYLAQALADKLVERERELIQACDVANRSQEVQAIEQEFDSLPDDVTEPWSNAPSR
jgi:ubiquinone biosynthesis protein UbiJ